jgi:hypothetical protein
VTQIILYLAMGDSPLSITASVAQFLGIRAAIQDVLGACLFFHSSSEYNADLAWLAASLKLELESLDQWGDYTGLKRKPNNGQTAASEHSILASAAVRNRVLDILGRCRIAINEVKKLVRINQRFPSASY